MDNLTGDFRYALRRLRASPGFTAALVVTLALGIGANTVVFSILNTLFLRPLPYPDPASLILAGELPLKQAPQGGMGLAAYPNFLDWSRYSRSFEHLAAYQADLFSFKAGGDPERLRGQRVSERYFHVLGMKPAAGRTFSSSEFFQAGGGVVVLSHALWTRLFGARPDAIGRSVRIDGHPAVVIGVMPEGFRPARVDGGADFWIPLHPRPAERDRSRRSVEVIGRLKERVAIDEARADLALIAGRLARQFPESNQGWGVRLERMQEHLAQAGRTALARLLVLAVAFVLLIACANAAGLLLARNAGRRKEFALRMAAGAGRWRVVRQLMIENVLLALLGGAAACLAAAWGLSYFTRAGAMMLASSGIPAFTIDARVLGFTACISLAAALVFGLLPACTASGLALSDALKEGGQAASAGKRQTRMSRALVTAEAALALILLASAGVVLHSIYRFWRLDWGFPGDRMLAIEIFMPERVYPGPAQRLVFLQTLLERLRGLPGVSAAALSCPLPVGYGARTVKMSIDAPGPDGESGTARAVLRVVSPDYLPALSSGVALGRGFSAQDAAGGAPVAIINRSMAEAFWKNGDPLGARVEVGGIWRTVVGVAPDLLNQGPWRKPGYEVTVPYGQEAPAAAGLMIRTRDDPRTLSRSVADVIRELDPDQPVRELRTMDEWQALVVSPLQFIFKLLAAFAGIALGLAALGIYSVAARSVALRTREFGIRLALGASGRAVVGEVVRQGAKIAGVALLLGGLGVAAVSRLLVRQVPWIIGSGPALFAAGALLVAAVTLAACWLPARRAVRLDPMAVLRAE